MKPLQRVGTGVPGLDDLLEGGLFEGGVYFVTGNPGTGKTTLANQICFSQVRQGRNAVYLTLLAESHTRMMQNMLGQSFFDAAAVPEHLSFVSGYRDLEAGGLRGVVALLRAELARQKASMAVLDGLVLPAAATADDARGLKEFVHELQGLSAMMGCVILMLTSGQGRSTAAEQTMVDGILSLQDASIGLRSERLIEVTKFRGSRTARGKHSFCITADGLRIYPRLESLPDRPSMPVAHGAGVTSGVPGLDELFARKGLREGSCTLVQGASGTGKTLLGLHFAAASSDDAPGLWVGFHEVPALLEDMALGMGLDLAALRQSGAMDLQWIGPGDQALDQLGYEVLERVDKAGVRRLVIDSVAGLADKATFGERGYRFLQALLDELRRRGVTTLLVSDPASLGALSAAAVAEGLPMLADQVVELRAAGTRHELRVHKARGQRVDGRPMDVAVGPTGLQLAARGA